MKHKIIYGIVALVVLAVLGLLMLNGYTKPKPQEIAWTLLVDQAIMDYAGEGEIANPSYKFTCKELIANPCLKSGGQFNTQTGDCSVNFGFTNCDDLAETMCTKNKGTYTTSTRTCDWKYFDGMFEDYDNGIYKYPLVNVGGHIVKMI